MTTVGHPPMGPSAGATVSNANLWIASIASLNSQTSTDVVLPSKTAARQRPVQAIADGLASAAATGSEIGRRP